MLRENKKNKKIYMKGTTQAEIQMDNRKSRIAEASGYYTNMC